MVAYSRELLARAAGELDSVPPGSATEQMLSNLPGDAGSGAGVWTLEQVSLGVSGSFMGK